MSNFGEDLDEIFGWLGRKNRFLWQARKNWKEVFQDSAQPRDLGEARGLSSGGLRRSLKGLDGLGPAIRQRIDILVIGGVPRLSGANKGARGRTFSHEQVICNLSELQNSVS